MQTTWTNVHAKVSFIRLLSPRIFNMKSRLTVRIRCMRGINQQLSFKRSSKEFWTNTSEMDTTFWSVWRTNSEKIEVLIPCFRIKNLNANCRSENTSESITVSSLFSLQDTWEHIFVEKVPPSGSIKSFFDPFFFPKIKSMSSWLRRQKISNENYPNLTNSKVQMSHEGTVSMRLKIKLVINYWRGRIPSDLIP